MIRMIRFLMVLFFPFLMSSTSCENNNDSVPDWEWDENEDEEKDKPRILWIDAAANFVDFANNKENIFRDMQLAKDVGFTSVVVDVRPTTGDVLFKTDVAEQVKWLGAWLDKGYSKVERTATWDYLQAFIDVGEEVGLDVYAGINTFVGGNSTSLGDQGVLFRDKDKKEWATYLLTESGVKSTMEVGGTGAKFFNPVREDVQNYICDMLEDLASYDGLKGIILDRGRFDELDSDFSDYTKNEFEEYLGYSVENFPEGVMVEGTTPGHLPSSTPEYFKKWLEFRAKVIHDFFEKAAARVKAVNPELKFGVYVGGWYSTYYGVGVNWASPEYNTASEFPTWATSEYKNYGYADIMDVILIGAYASPTKVYGTAEWTIQGFCSQAKRKIKGAAMVIGGPDVGNGAWATASNDVTNDAITQSVEAVLDVCDGYFLFDMIHLKKKDQWDAVKEGIGKVITPEEGK
ncbi:alpha amylase family protein [Thermophagus sp. OGC60D27]|uniref:alpha amylase family protein n=1 Tax=Thermophagus sp. OGC60D27 TaxID=3458415 RepID=UPI004037F9D4